MNKPKIAALACAFYLLAACTGSGGSDTPETTAAESGTEITTDATAETTSGSADTPAPPPVTEASVPAAVTTGSTAAPQTTATSKTTPAASKKPNVITVCIPEGLSLSQIGDTLEAAGVCKKTDLLLTANSYDYSYYPLIAAIPEDPNRCFKLEGYLFPDTYEFYINMKPQDVLGRLIRGAENNIKGFAREGMTTDEIVILASVIEKETGDRTLFAKIASVFHNRLKAGMKLQSDATIQYIEWYVKPNLDGDINRYNSAYNTYKCPALPAGPICSPGRHALAAAASPAETEYMYFVSNKDGTVFFAATYEEHLQNCVLAGIGPATETTPQQEGE